MKIFHKDVFRQNRICYDQRRLPAHVRPVNFPVLLSHLLTEVKEDLISLLGDVADEPARPWATDAHWRPVAELASEEAVI